MDRRVFISGITLGLLAAALAAEAPQVAKIRVLTPGPGRRTIWRREASCPTSLKCAATYVDKIPKGANPADLPLSSQNIRIRE
jgi:hypothetical protein